MLKHKTDPAARFEYVGRKQNPRGTEAEKCLKAHQLERSGSDEICWEANKQDDRMGNSDYYKLIILILYVSSVKIHFHIAPESLACIIKGKT